MIAGSVFGLSIYSQNKKAMPILEVGLGLATLTNPTEIRKPKIILT